ncbi:unnamed protein product, partial [Ectocarpus sp. 12 AP-2014]
RHYRRREGRGTKRWRRPRRHHQAVGMRGVLHLMMVVLLLLAAVLLLVWVRRQRRLLLLLLLPLLLISVAVRVEGVLVDRHGLTTASAAAAAAIRYTTTATTTTDTDTVCGSHALPSWLPRASRPGDRASTDVHR